MRDLMTNIDMLKAEIQEYRNKEKYLPEARKRKRSKKQKSST